MVNNAKMPTQEAISEHSCASRNSVPIRATQASSFDSDDEQGDNADEEVDADGDDGSVVGISISNTQSRMKSPTTPRAEKIAAMEGQPDFFSRDTHPMEAVAELPPQDALEDITSSDSDARKHSDRPVKDVPRSKNTSEAPLPASLPSPWRAGPQKTERREETGLLLGSVFRKRSSSGPEKKGRLPISLPGLPRLFGGSTSQVDVAKTNRQDQDYWSRYVSRLDGAGSSREATSETKRIHNRPVDINGQDASGYSCSATTSNDISGRTDGFGRQEMGLRRANSDQSLSLARTLSKASSLGDDSRFENVNEQINSRLKAIRDSWQDSNLRRNLPSLPKTPSMFSSKLDLTASTEASRNTSGINLSNGFVSVGNASTGPSSSNARKASASVSGPSSIDHPYFTEALRDLVGDVVILGGYRGSVLREAQAPQRRLWLPLFKAGLNLRKVDLEVDFDDDGRATESVKPDGMLTHIGPVDISRRLLKRLRKSDNAMQGRLRVHEYGYDWRLSPHRLSQQLLTFLAQLPSNSPDTPSAERGATVIAHSLGGLITRWVVNSRPDLFAGVIYAGVPETCVNILGPLRNGDQVLMSSRVLTAQVNLSIRTSIVLLPLDGKCFIDKDTNEEYPVDFYNVNDWLIKYRFSPCTDPPLPASPDPGKTNGLLGAMANMIPDAMVSSLISRRESTTGQNHDAVSEDRTSNAVSSAAVAGHAEAHSDGVPHSGMAPKMELTSADDRIQESIAGITITRQQAIDYLSRVLPEIKRFRQELAHCASLQEQNKYPPLAVIYGKTEPTVYGARVRGRDGIRRSDAYSYLAFRSGDGVVLAKSAQLPQGYRAARGGVVASERGHVTLLSDLEAIGRCITALHKARQKGVGLGVDHRFS